MLSTLLLSAVLVAAPQARPDTAVELRRGDRVVVANVSGDLRVEAWGRDALEIVSEDRDERLRVSRSGSEVRIERRDGRRGRRGDVDALVRVPAWVDLEVRGLSLDLSVRGVEGSIDVGNASGDIMIRDARGPVDARTIDGEILIDGAAQGVRASSQSDDVTMRRISGPVEVHSGSGDVLLDDITSTSVRAETQDGDIAFSGTIADDGTYGFFVHDGDALITVPSTMNASVSVSTFDGEFESEFPVLVQRFTGGREFDFVVGTGSARVQIEVFDGEIRLLRRR